MRAFRDITLVHHRPNQMSIFHENPIYPARCAKLPYRDNEKVHMPL